MENTIAVVSDPLFVEHREPGPEPGGHPERPERLDAARRGFFSALPPERVAALAPRDASHDELGLAHKLAYLEQLSRTAGRRGYLDADTYYAPASYAAAIRAAGGGIQMGDPPPRGRGAHGGALVRPPRPHPRPGTATGFSCVTNSAVAAAPRRAHS